ncbi:hypothetical protein PN499_10470 [Kamptonema animale CS-326]|nr:hypothetical protein [Kamptonema animale]MDB9511606.1 hypothetical protein [Kamptonema animale CS-326]
MQRQPHYLIAMPADLRRDNLIISWDACGLWHDPLMGSERTLPKGSVKP